MNITKFEDGRNAVVEELLCLKVDTREALDRYDELSLSMDKHLREFTTAVTAARVAIGALNQDIEMLRQETGSNREELERRLSAIDNGAIRLGYPFLPTLRVVIPIGDESA